MRLLFATMMILLYCSAPAVAQTSPQNTLTINCRSRILTVLYFCWQYQTKQEAAWNQRVRQPTDKAEFNLRLDKLAANKVIVGLTVTFGGVRHERTLIVAVDNKHLTASATKVTETTTATLDLWTKR